MLLVISNQWWVSHHPECVTQRPPDVVHHLSRLAVNNSMEPCLGVLWLIHAQLVWREPVVATSSQSQKDLVEISEYRPQHRISWRRTAAWSHVWQCCGLIHVILVWPETVVRLLVVTDIQKDLWKSPNSVHLIVQDGAKIALRSHGCHCLVLSTPCCFEMGQ